MTDKEERLYRNALTEIVLSFISPKSGMIDVEGLVQFLIDRAKEKKET